jgi:hypothetical protein
MLRQIIQEQKEMYIVWSILKHKEANNEQLYSYHYKTEGGLWVPRPGQ